MAVTLIFGIWASEPPPGPGKRLKRLGLIGLTDGKSFFSVPKYLHMNQKRFIKNFDAYALYRALFTDHVKFEFNYSIPFNFLLKFFNWWS